MIKMHCAYWPWAKRWQAGSSGDFLLRNLAGNEIAIYISGPQIWTNVEYVHSWEGRQFNAGVINLIHLYNVERQGPCDAGTTT